MREIKFRAKYFDEWYFGTIVTRKVKDKGRMRNIYILMGLDNENWIPLREDQYDTIGQFTDLRDKNEKEIYEGDIVQSDKYTYVVVYNAHYASFGLCREQDAFLHYFGEALYADECEVIGNVHDNPDLAKKVLGEKVI